MKGNIRRLCRSDILREYDAFVLFFMGFGDYRGQLFDCNDQPVSIKTDILPNFNSASCPALEDKPKILCFQVAKPGLIVLYIKTF